MMTMGQGGGATRNATAGASRTRSADRTRPSAPICAIQPVAAAAVCDTSAIGTTAMPAICATAIIGIARKLSARPAKVTRENTRAPTGKSIASAATDAANIAIKDRRIPARFFFAFFAFFAFCAAVPAGIPDVTTGTTTIIASVAPNVRMNAGSTTDNGSAPTSSAATKASVFSGGLR